MNKSETNPTFATGPKLFITGGLKLFGHVSISGSKNAALPILAATLCGSGTSMLTNVPVLSDTTTMVSMLTSLGADVRVSRNEVMINVDEIKLVEPDPTCLARFRGGFIVIGPLLGRFGEAVVALPGGCNIGARPVDAHINGLRGLGAVVEMRNDKVEAYVANGKHLTGGSIRLEWPSVGATQTLIMAACMAQGNTILSNCAQEPEIVDLVHFLMKMGACIEGAGTGEIHVHGRNGKLFGVEHAVMPDRIEIGSFLLAAAITRSSISLSPASPDWVHILIDKLSSAGCKIKHMKDTLEISANEVELRGFDIETLPYPGFATDLQPQTMALLATCDGVSILKESVFENRMSHGELKKLGAKIHVDGNSATIYGLGREGSLHGARVIATDLRAGMALVLAALVAEGITEISGVSHIDRGYENLETKLQHLGVCIKRSG